MSIYLDNNATTQLDKKVLKKMLIDLKGPPYNPSSNHFFGKKAHALLIQARAKIANILKKEKEEILFTSSASETLNMLIRGFSKKDAHIITTDVEHPCIFNCVKNLKNVSFLKTGPCGVVKEDQILSAIKPNTKLLILSFVYSETGVICDIEKIAKIASDNNIFFIVDGVAAIGKIKFTIPKEVSSMVFSAHKIHGPKGCSFAFIKKDFPYTPLILGGSQEYNKRAGTENLSGILGAAKALELAYDKIDQKIEKMQSLRDLLEELLKKELDISINGKGLRVCNVSNIAFPNISAEDLLMLLNQNKIYASHSSACTSRSFKPSRVLLNMGIKETQVKSSIRFSISRMNTKKEIIHASKTIIQCVKKLKNN